MHIVRVLHQQEAEIGCGLVRGGNGQKHDVIRL